MNLPAGAPAAGARATGATATGARATQAGDARSQNRSARQDQVGQNRDARQQEFQQNQGTRQQERSARGDEIRNEFHDNHPRADFYADHPDWARYRINHPYHPVAWGALAGFVGYGVAGGGGGGSYDYSEDTAYVNGEATPIDEQYAEEATQIAQAGTAAQPDNTEWMALGVFALVQEEKGEPTMFLQLMISKQGIIGGTYNNTATNQTATISGSLDRDTQRVAMFTEKKTPVVETGLQNLTQDQAPALVHFKDGTTQRWLLVRVPEPKDAPKQ